ncbi:MAG TPA: radical SAM protein [Bacteroidales bacterium]|nr:radical SAM protein [Bacteroidales bacterium]
MYTAKDYINRGMRFANNSIFPRHKKLSTIMLYSTDRCNLKCRHCFIWAKKPKQDLNLEKIKEIINSPVVSNSTMIGLEGGEFILHPEAEDILKYLSVHHKNFELLTNGRDANTVIEYTKKYKPVRLYLSMDGTRETIEKLRQADIYDNILKVIESLKDELPISVMFTLTPFNTFEDMEHVANVCKQHGLDMRIGLYNTMEYFETQSALDVTDTMEYKPEDIPEFVKDFSENYDFMYLYTKFREGKLKLPCRSITDSIVIYPNGDIPICQFKEIILGNLHKESLKQIINKRETVKKHKEHLHGCNACWVNFHRKYDIVLHRNLEKLMPKGMVQWFLGKYHWTENKKIKYSKLFKGE